MLFVAGCGGSPTQFALRFPETNLSGTTYVGRGIAADFDNTSGTSNIRKTSAELVFTPTEGTGADAYSSVRLVTSDGQTVYQSDTALVAMSTDGTDVLGFSPGLSGGPATKDMLFVIQADSTGFFPETLGMYVLGNRTPVSDLPNINATYNGVASFMNSVDPRDLSSGTMSMNVDFGAQALNIGTMSINSGSLSGITLDAAPTALTGSNFSTTLTSAQTAISDSSLEGRFFGNAAKELGGTMHITDPSGTFIGFFGANR